MYFKGAQKAAFLQNGLSDKMVSAEESNLKTAGINSVNIRGKTSICFAFRRSLAQSLVPSLETREAAASQCGQS